MPPWNNRLKSTPARQIIVVAFRIDMQALAEPQAIERFPPWLR
jgi:hypothetical protein